MKKIIFGIIILMFIIPSQSWAACDWDDKRCFVMTNDYDGEIYMAKTMFGEWSVPIKVFEDEMFTEYVVRDDLLSMIFWTSYRNTGKYVVYVYIKYKDGPALEDMREQSRKHLSKEPRLHLGGNLEKFRWSVAEKSYDLKNKIYYEGGKWNLMLMDDYGQAIMMYNIPWVGKPQPFTKRSERIAKGIIAAFDREVKIAREKGQIP